MTKSTRTRALLLGSLTSLVLIQSYRLWTSDVWVWAKALWRTRAMTGMERSARFYLGEVEARYMDFLDRTIPRDVSVVVPENALQFSQQSILQYYLMPRTVVTCGCGTTRVDEMSSACMRCLRSEGSAVPAIGAFPPDAVLEGTKELVPFTESDWLRGVYVPPGWAGGDVDGVQVEPQGRVRFLLTELGLLAVWSGLGFFLASRLLPARDRLLRLALALPLGVGTVTWLWFVLAWMGMPVDRLSFAVAFGGVLLAAGLLRSPRDSVACEPGALERRGTSRSAERSFLVRLPVLAGVGWAGALFAAALVVSYARSYSTFDGIVNWGLKGYAIATFGSISAVSQWGGHGASYPLNIPLAVAAFHVLDGDLMAGSKLLFPVFGFSMAVGIFWYLRKVGLDLGLGLLWTLLVVSVPVGFWYATTAFANTPFAAYLVLGALLLLEGLRLNDRRIAWTATLLLSLAMWTRPEGLAYALVLLLATFISFRRVRPWRVLSVRHLVPLALVPSLWLAFSLQSLAGDEIGGTANRIVQEVTAGRFHTDNVLFVIRYALGRLTDVAVWGCIAVAVVAALVLSRARKGWARLPVGLGPATLAALLFPLGMLYLASFDKPDLRLFLDVSFDRAFLPAAALLVTAAATSLRPVVSAPGQGG